MKKFKTIFSYFLIAFVVKFCLDTFLFRPNVSISLNLFSALITSVAIGLALAWQRSKKEVVANSSSNSTFEAMGARGKFRKEFSLSASRIQFIVLLLGGLWIFTLLFAWMDNDLTLSNKIFLSTLIIASFLLCLISIYKSRLIFTEQGIEFVELFITVKGDWKNVKEIFTTRGREQVLILKTAACLTYFGSKSATDYEINLSGYEDAWQTGEIGRLIKENAVQLEFIEHKNSDPLESEGFEEDGQWKAIRRAIKGDK